MIAFVKKNGLSCRLASGRISNLVWGPV